MNDTTQFQDTIARSREILVVLPPNPQFDIISAGLALYKSLAAFGKKTYIFCPTPMLVEFNRLVGIDQVGDKLGEKNLTINLRDYPAGNIERVSYDIENGEMKLTIIPKDGTTSPVKEQVEISLSGIAADTAIFVEVEREEQLGEIGRELAKIPQSVQILTSKPQTSERRGAVEIVDPGSSSLSETVGMLLTNANLPLDEDTAANLFLGLTAATNNFTSSRVRAETFELASRLVRAKGGVATSQQLPAGNVSSANDEPPHPAQQEQTPQDWFKPKIYKGTTLP